MRLTDTAWGVLGKMADEQKITRADLIEELASSEAVDRISDRDEIERLRGEVARLAVENESLAEQLLSAQAKLGFDEVQELRTKVLDDLGMGHQSKAYKNANKAFAKFIQSRFSM